MYIGKRFWKSGLSVYYLLLKFSKENEDIVSLGIKNIFMKELEENWMLFVF